MLTLKDNTKTIKISYTHFPLDGVTHFAAAARISSNCCSNPCTAPSMATHLIDVAYHSASSLSSSFAAVAYRTHQHAEKERNKKLKVFAKMFREINVHERILLCRERKARGGPHRRLLQAALQVHLSNLLTHLLQLPLVPVRLR